VDTFRVLHPDANLAGTFNGFDGQRDGPKIDYVFVEPDTRVREAGIVHDNRDGRYPSDHYPVYAEILLPAP
jgi:endonuclease/exonuclease/phosphatase family metal-dependent hydrolase